MELSGEKDWKRAVKRLETSGKKDWKLASKKTGNELGMRYEEDSGKGTSLTGS